MAAPYRNGDRVLVRLAKMHRGTAKHKDKDGWAEATVVETRGSGDTHKGDVDVEWMNVNGALVQTCSNPDNIKRAPTSRAEPKSRTPRAQKKKQAEPVLLADYGAILLSNCFVMCCCTIEGALL